MMGAGLYTLLGSCFDQVVACCRWLVIAGVVAALSVYSYAKLGSAYPSRGGAAVYFAGRVRGGPYRRRPERIPVRGLHHRDCPTPLVSPSTSPPG